MLGSRVRSIRQAEGRFLVEVGGRSCTADRSWWRPGRSRCRSCRRSASSSGKMSFSYTAPVLGAGDLPDGRVLVVGGGNTGFQIAEELSATREVHLSIGSRQTRLPQRILGRDLFWYLEKIGAIGKSTDTRIGRRLAGERTRSSAPIPGPCASATGSGCIRVRLKVPGAPCVFATEASWTWAS